MRAEQPTGDGVSSHRWRGVV